MLIQTTAAVSHGNSGGPLINMDGEAIGIAIFILKEGQSLNFALGINEVKTTLENPNLLTSAAPSTSSLSHIRTPTKTRRVASRSSVDSQKLYTLGTKDFELAQKSAQPSTARNHYQKALNSFMLVAASHPEWTGAICMTGICFFELENYKEALQWLKRAAPFYPKDSYLLHSIGYCLYDLKSYKEAIIWIKRAAPLEPKDYNVYYLLAKCNEELHEWAASGESYARAAQLVIEPDNKVEYWHEAGRMFELADRQDRAIDNYKKAVDYQLKSEETNYYKNGARLHLGTIYRIKSRIAEATQLFDDYVKLSKDKADAYNDIGKILQDTDTNDSAQKNALESEAIEAFKKSLQIDPANFTAQIWLAYRYKRFKMWQNAALIYESIKDPYYSLRFDLADCYANLGRYGDALTTYSHTCDMDLHHEPKEMYQRANELNYRLGADKPCDWPIETEQAIVKLVTDQYKAVIREKPDMPDAHYSLASMYKKLEQWKESADEFHEGFRLKFDESKIMDAFDVAEKLKKWDDMLEYLKMLVHLKPENIYTYFTLGFVLRNLNRNSDAIAAFRKPLSLKFADPTSYVKLGDEYRNYEMCDEARQAYLKAIAIKSKDTLAIYGLGIVALKLSDRATALDEYKALKPLDAKLAEDLFKAIYP